MSKAKGGLGKGLSALIPSSSSGGGSVPREQPVVAPGGDHTAPAGSITHLPLSSIRPNPFQPRADFDQQALDELKQSIRQKGIIQPVTVRQAANGMYELISGERRLRACLEIGLATIPAYVIEVHSDAEMLELALVENLQREHLNPIEIAISYQRLLTDVALTVEEVANKVSKDRTTVTNFLRLLKLPERIQNSLRKGEISAGHARAILGLSDDVAQIRLFERIVKKDLNVRQVERLVRDQTQKSGKRAPGPPGKTQSAIGSIEERMQQILGTRVKIHLAEGGKGEIKIEFYSNDDLARLFDLLSTIQP
jgi:ParB family transcriptional regulator, chromosome partitioning protein